VGGQLHLQRQSSNLGGRVQNLENQARSIIEKPLTGGGLSVRGDKALYKVIVLREYDEDDVLVDIGSESDPLTTGHTLEPTWDWTRAHA
jgi:hypothetical protein